MDRPHYWIDERNINMNVTSNSTPDKSNLNDRSITTKLNKKELNKSTDSRIMARKDEKTAQKHEKTTLKVETSAKKNDDSQKSLSIKDIKSNNKVSNNKLRTLVETEDEKNSIVILIRFFFPFLFNFCGFHSFFTIFNILTK